MPPRRTPRSRASVEPESAERANPNKRKRISPNENEAPVQEDTPDTKPSSRARKPASARSTPAPTSQRRVGTRARASLQEVPESGGEDNEGPSERPVKKSRPSLEKDEEDEESEVEEVKPQRTRRQPAKKASTSSAPRRRTAVKEEEADEEMQDAKEDITEPRQASVEPSTRGRVVRASRAKRGIKQADESDEEAAPAAVEVSSSDDEDEDAPKPRGKGRQPPAKKKATKRDEDDEDFEEEEAKPARRTRKTPSARPSAGPSRRGRASSAKPASSTRGKGGSASKNVKDEPTEVIPPSASFATPPKEDDDDDDDELYTVSPSKRRRAPVRPTPIKEVEETEDVEEEEKSLLEPDVTVMPAAAPQTQELPPVPEEPEGPKARLVIHKLVLVDFKSYAGRQEIGPFHKSFSSIVGPNGSGKSNTIDALLFVFGYRASKMRQGKLSELIHNSARFPNLEECSVEVHFREIIDLPGQDAFDLVPDSQLIVTRTAYRNNTSRYTINQRQSNYKEVQTLLKGRGIDLDHNRFLILQGEVESISQMKPKAPSEHEDGLLEYLEDIIGTSRFKEEIDAALVEMDKYQEEKNEKLNRLKIVERQRDALEAQKKEAEAFLRKQNDLVRAQSKLWQFNLYSCFETEKTLARELHSSEAKLEEETEQNRAQVDNYAALEEQCEAYSETFEQVKEAAQFAAKALMHLEKQQVSVEERRKHAAAKAKKLQKSVTNETRSKEEAERTIIASGDKIKKHKRELDEREAELAREEKILEDIRDSLKDRTQVFHDKIEIKQKELEPWTEKINRKQAEIDVASGERDALAKKAEALQKSAQEAEETLGQLREEHQAKVDQLEELKENKESKQREFQSGKRSLQNLRAELDKLKSTASSARSKYEDAKRMKSDNSSQNAVLEGLTRLRASGRVSGFHGRLGALGVIPEEYDIAVSTACPSLNNLVVDTVEQGQTCIEHLRRNKLGRASFIVLEKLSNHGMEKIKTPENVPRLFDLIKPKDPRFAPAFYKAATNTLVVKDMDQARRIAYNQSRRWRVVTLAGQLIEATGAMTGGGTSVFRGLMSSKLAAEEVSPEELRQLEATCRDAEERRDDAARKLRELEAELEAMAQAGPSIDTAIQKINMDIRNAASRIEETQVRVRELRAQNKPNSGDLARIAKLESTIAKATSDLEKLEERAGAIKAEIAGYEQKILEIGGSKLLAQKSKVEGISLHISIANDEITKAEVAQTKAEKDVTKYTNSIESNETALEATNAELESLEKEFEVTLQLLEESREKVGEAEATVDTAKDKMDGFKNALDTATEKIREFRQLEATLKQKIADLRKQASDNDGYIAYWQDRHGKLRLVQVGDEDDDEDDENEDQSEKGDEGGNDKDNDDDNAEVAAPEIVKPDPDGPIPKKQHNSLVLREYKDSELATFDRKSLERDFLALEDTLSHMSANMGVLKDYAKLQEEWNTRAQDYENTLRLREEQKEKYERLRNQRLTEFMAGFNAISLKLKEMYQMITLGGNAELELVDSIDPFSEGIIFSVMPPKKSWRNISNLSGGEKTLSSLALVFALHVYKPTPLYFMDEIDAALDFRNVSIVANYIKDRTKNAQFIIISLRNDMFELSHRLIGIYKTSNATRSIAIDNHKLQEESSEPVQA